MQLQQIWVLINIHSAMRLLKMYAALEGFLVARLVFDKMPCRDFFTWSIMINEL